MEKKSQIKSALHFFNLSLKSSSQSDSCVSLLKSSSNHENTSS